MEAVRRLLAVLLSAGLSISPVAAQIRVVPPSVARPVAPVVVPQAPSLSGAALPQSTIPSLRTGPDFSPSQLATVKATSDSLERAVAVAAGSALPGAAMAVRSRGSSSRATHVDSDPDYDVMVRVDAGGMPQESAEKISGNLAAIKAALIESVGREAAALYPGVDLKVAVGGPVQLSDPADRKRVDGVFMLPVQVIGPSGVVLMDSDVTFTGRPEYANAYPEHFDAQLAALARNGVPAEKVLSDVRLAKRFFKDVLGSYKAWQGGPSGVGVEQMVMQAGGSFDGMMEKVFAAAYRPDGVPRGLKQARRVWNVENRFMAPANFLDLFSDKAWAKTAYAAKAYREAKAAGATLSFDDMRAPVPAPVPAVAARKEIPVTAFVASNGFDARVTVASSVSGEAFEKLTKRLSRRMGFGRARPARTGKGVIAFDFRLNGAAPETFVAAAKAFFDKPNNARLLEISVPASPAAAPAADTAGAMTLDMLTRFTQHGPAPAARGDAYLYAQGAKALPPGLETSRPPAAPLTAPANGSVIRTKFFRRGGRAYVMLDDPEAEGPNTQRPVKVPAKFAQGIVTDTLVEVAAAGKFITALRPIGAYSADVVIGRVVKIGNSLLLGPLFTGDSAKALYEPLALSESAREGDILQAFVRKTAGGYEAVPLIALGTQLTPEIAAREIALRHGARAYFERSVIEQAEEVGRTQDPEADFKRMKESKGRAEDLRALPFVTIDPIGAGDLDDAYYIRKEADGSWTWYLATADVAAYVRPGTPAFRAAARIGNTFYSPDKDGVPEYPMNHPVVSKSISSLLAGKDSLAMVTKMRFSPEGKFLLDDSEVYLGLVRVQGRYTYNQVAALWKGEKRHGITHLDQVSLARELAAKLGKADDARGKLALSFTETRHVKDPDGRWRTETVEHDPLETESHRLIEELKVYGNRAIATRLETVADAAKAPHISRVHPHQEEKVDERLRKQLSSIGVPWRDDETLWNYLARLKGGNLRPELRETAQLLALMSRASALYAADDAEGHEGLALDAKAYDHPSAPIRRFSDMYNRALLEAYLEGGDAKAVHEAVLADLKALGFADFEEYLSHLNGREQASRRMDREFDGFMSVYELAKPENKGRAFTGYVKILKEGRNAEAVIQLRELPVTVTLQGDDARRMKLLGEVTVTIRSADPSKQTVDAAVRPKTK